MMHGRLSERAFSIVLAAAKAPAIALLLVGRAGLPAMRQPARRHEACVNGRSCGYWGTGQRAPASTM
jgi:hypothetical protein